MLDSLCCGQFCEVCGVTADTGGVALLEGGVITDSSFFFSKEVVKGLTQSWLACWYCRREFSQLEDLKLDKLQQFVLDECDKCLDKVDMRKDFAGLRDWDN